MQIALLEETINNLSNEKIIATLEDAVDELNEQHSSFVTKAHLMVSNLTNLDEPLECAVLAYRYHRDYSWSDIAERLHLTEKSVQVVYEKALVSLEDYLDELNDAEEM